MSDGLTAAAFTSTSTSPAPGEIPCRSTTGAIAAASAAFSSRRRQDASMAWFGLGIVVIRTFGIALRPTRRAALPDRFPVMNLRRPRAHGQQIVARHRLAVLVEDLDIPAHLAVF